MPWKENLRQLFSFIHLYFIYRGKGSSLALQADLVDLLPIV